MWLIINFLTIGTSYTYKANWESQACEKYFFCPELKLGLPKQAGQYMRIHNSFTDTWVSFPQSLTQQVILGTSRVHWTNHKNSAVWSSLKWGSGPREKVHKEIKHYWKFTVSLKKCILHYFLLSYLNTSINKIFFFLTWYSHFFRKMFLKMKYLLWMLGQEED